MKKKPYWEDEFDDDAVALNQHDLFEITKFLVVTLGFLVVGVFLLMRAVETRAFDFLSFTAGAISMVFAGILAVAFIIAFFQSSFKK